MRRNPPASNTTKAMESTLKYLSINVDIFAPNFQMRAATRKKLAARATGDTIMNVKRLEWTKPAVLVNS